MKKHLLILALFLTFAGCNDKPEISPSSASSGLSSLQFSIAPNPASNVSFISVDSQDGFTLLVFDTYGKTMLEQNVSGEGSYRFQVPLADKPQGTYHVVLKSKVGTFKQNILKL